MNTPYQTLLKSEKIKQNKTKSEIPGFYNFIPSVYNVFIKMPFIHGTLAEDIDTELIKIQDLFQFFVYDFPFKARNIYNLMEIGSYFDATILFRSLVKSFIIYKGKNFKISGCWKVYDNVDYCIKQFNKFKKYRYMFYYLYENNYNIEYLVLMSKNMSSYIK